LLALCPNPQTGGVSILQYLNCFPLMEKSKRLFPIVDKFQNGQLTSLVALTL